MSLTVSAGTDPTCFPAPQSYCTTYSTTARHDPSGQRSHASCQPGHQAPSRSTSTRRGSSNRRTSTVAVCPDCSLEHDTAPCQAEAAICACCEAILGGAS